MGTTVELQPGYRIHRVSGRREEISDEPGDRGFPYPRRFHPPLGILARHEPGQDAAGSAAGKAADSRQRQQRSVNCAGAVGRPGDNCTTLTYGGNDGYDC